MSDITPARTQALEHVAWCLKEGLTLAELHAALGPQAGPRFRCWEDAIAQLALIADYMAICLDRESRRRQPEPFRRREPPRSTPRNFLPPRSRVA